MKTGGLRVESIWVEWEQGEVKGKGRGEEEGSKMKWMEDAFNVRYCGDRS